MRPILNPLIYYACERLYSRDNGEALVHKYHKSEGSIILQLQNINYIERG